MRIAYPVILLGWTANPAQREQQRDTEHQPRRKITSTQILLYSLYSILSTIAKKRLM